MRLPALATIATFAATFSSVILAEYLHAPLGRRAVAEGALIEDTSAILWFLAAAVSFVAAWRRRDVRGDLFLIGWLLLIFGLRELDFHTRFTTWNVTHPIKYTKAEIPLTLRAPLFVLIFVPLLTAGLLALTRWRRAFIAAWRSGATWTREIMLWGAVIGFARVADKLTGTSDGWHPTLYQVWLLRAGEESLELSLAVLTLVMVASLVAIRAESPVAAVPSQPRPAS